MVTNVMNIMSILVVRSLRLATEQTACSANLTTNKTLIGSKCPGIFGTHPGFSSFVPGPRRPFNLSIVCPGILENLHIMASTIISLVAKWRGFVSYWLLHSDISLVPRLLPMRYAGRDYSDIVHKSSTFLTWHCTCFSSLSPWLKTALLCLKPPKDWL